MDFSKARLFFMAYECQENLKIELVEDSGDISKVRDRDIVDFKLVDVLGREKNLVGNLELEIERSERIVCGKGIVVGKSLLGKSKLINEAVANSCRSITDLPPALVSEILNCLDPKELGIVSCVSTSLCKVAAEHHVWKEFYCERWGLPVAPAALGSDYSDEKSWKELFVEREYRSKTFLGRYSIDCLYGHREPVRAVFVLNSKKLIFTSGYDSIVRMWDLEEGTAISASRALGCTIRAVAADTKLLIAGGTDGFVHGWRAEEGHPHLFDFSGPQNQNTEFRLWEHEGPITCLQLDFTRIFSGSWDMTVRVWDRSSLKCLTVLRHNDWVWSLAPHVTTLASTSGSDLYVWDIDSGTPVVVVNDAHVGNTYALARSHTGKLLFTGGEDGVIKMYEITSQLCNNVRQVAKWNPHTGPVYSLAFEFPWLVSASSDGKLSLIDIRKLLKKSKNYSSGSISRLNHENKKFVEPPQRMLHGFGCNLFSVDIGSDRIVCGGEEGVVRIWNFSQALETEQRVRALKGIRLENRMRRRKLQTEMNGKGAKKNQMGGDRNGVGIKRGVSGKLKA